jgi:acid phosphatase family membrane protein YuiD
MNLAAGIVKDINIFEIVRHPWFVSSFLAGGLAQLIKFTTCLIRTKKANFSYFATAGGMPSAHASLVSALASAVGFTEGFDAPYAMIAVGLGLIVLCDAATLRREAGRHAELLNHIVEKLNDHFDEAERIEARRLKERLGHKRREVFVGVVFGMLVAYVVCAIWDFWK